MARAGLWNASFPDWRSRDALAHDLQKESRCTACGESGDWIEELAANADVRSPATRARKTSMHPVCLTVYIILEKAARALTME